MIDSNADSRSVTSSLWSAALRARVLAGQPAADMALDPRTNDLADTDADAAVAAIEFAVAEVGRIDVAVNNAGYANSAAIEEMEPDDFRAQIEANLFGVVNVARAALPVLRKQRSGVFVQFSSGGGRVGGARVWAPTRRRSSPSRGSPKCSPTRCGRSV